MSLSPHALVTGGAGFIGSHVVARLLNEGWAVTSIDNRDGQADIHLPQHNAGSTSDGRYRHLLVDIRDMTALRECLAEVPIDATVHLGALIGSRRSLLESREYMEVNVLGTHNVLEVSRQLGARRFVFASDGSVYGRCGNVPQRETEPTRSPINPYAATKISGELLGHVSSHLYGLRFIALRLFSVYGPGQPQDTVISKFTRLMLEGAAIPVFGSGHSCRDYVYVDDIVPAILAAMDYDSSPYEIVNLGSSHATPLVELIEILEDVLNVRARVERLPEQFGDIPYACADNALARQVLGFNPQISLYEGISRYSAWLQQPRPPPTRLLRH